MAASWVGSGAVALLIFFIISCFFTNISLICSICWSSSFRFTCSPLPAPPPSTIVLVTLFSISVCLDHIPESSASFFAGASAIHHRAGHLVQHLCLLGPHP